MSFCVYDTAFLIRCLTFDFSKRRSAQWRAGAQNSFYMCVDIRGPSGDDSEAAVGMVPQLGYGLSSHTFSK